MIKDLAWKIFKNTGNIDTFLELKQIENLKNMTDIINGQKVEIDGNSKNKGNNNF